jgi:glycine oxidase
MQSRTRGAGMPALSEVCDSVSESFDAVVVGGGIIGCSVAWRLVQTGRRVAVLERGHVGGEASSAAGGLLSPHGAADRPAHLLRLWDLSNKLYPQFVEDVRAATDQLFDYRRCGRVTVAITDDEVAKLHREFLLQEPSRVNARWLSGADARAVEPLLSPDVQAAIHYPDHALVHNPRFTRAIGRAFRRAGGTLYENRGVTGFVVEHDRITAVETPTGIVNAPVVVNCAGSWAGSIDRRAWQPIRPVKGQMVVVDLGAPALQCSVGCPQGGALPRTEGQTLVGATTEDVGFDKDVTMGAISGVFERTARVLPSLRSARLVDAWAGLRPTAPDREPVMGADSAIEGLHWATGHSTMGILAASATSRAMADLIDTGRSSIPIDEFSPARFAVATR